MGVPFFKYELAKVNLLYVCGEVPSLEVMQAINDEVTLLTHSNLFLIQAIITDYDVKIIESYVYTGVRGVLSAQCVGSLSA